MFSQKPEECIRNLGERQMIDQIRTWLGPVVPESPEGIGDDCAVLRSSAPPHTQLLTTDSVTYGHHFNDAIAPEKAGEMLVKRNLSDIAAMGGSPGPALLNLLCGPDLSIAWLEAFIGGIRHSCETYGVRLVGGDVSQIASGHFSSAITLAGSVVGQPKLRSTASVGDAIYVTGTLGGSIRGKHYNFEPRLPEGQWLARESACSAMMDLTDGLGKDLAALLPAESSAEILLNELPISSDAEKCAASDNQSAEEHAFCDGEDYELLFTLSAGADLPAFEQRWAEAFPNLELSRIGTIVKANPDGLYIDKSSRKPLPWQSGFEHFKSR